MEILILKVHISRLTKDHMVLNLDIKVRMKSRNLQDPGKEIVTPFLWELNSTEKIGRAHV